MSNLLFGIAGAAIGSVFGMPALGFALGSGVGATLGSHHPAASPAWPGARLNDLKVQTSTYGIGIPRVYGMYRLAGNVIWATDIIEAKDSAGHYSYYGHFALGLCAGPVAGIRRIWADGKEVFQADTAVSDNLRTHYPPTLRFYPGDETQLPDPLIEAHQGKGQTPAFRGLAYLVFERLPLAHFNNRLPSITVEMVQSAIEHLPVAPEPDPATPAMRQPERKARNGRYSPPIPTRRPTPPAPVVDEKKQIPAAVPLQQIVRGLCQEAGFPDTQIEVSLLSDTVRGWVLSPPYSAREALGILQQAYGFDVVESGRRLRCVPRGALSPLPVSDNALVIEEGAESTQNGMTRLSEAELPQQVTVFFTEAGKDYRLATQTAQRAAGIRHASERVELPLVLNQQEAAHMAQSILAERFQSRTQLSFSLSRAYAALEPGDRLLLQGNTLRVLSVAYGSPGLVKIQAVLETG